MGKTLKHKTKQQRDRINRLMPGGVPRYIRCWDTGDEGDRYTVVYCGRYRTLGLPRHADRGQWGWFQYVGMNETPSDPLYGICQHGESPNVIDCPQGWTEQIGRRCRFNPALGRRIRFEDLPAACRKVVVDDYCELWGLPKQSLKFRDVVRGLINVESMDDRMLGSIHFNFGEWVFRPQWKTKLNDEETAELEDYLSELNTEERAARRNLGLE